MLRTQRQNQRLLAINVAAFDSSNIARQDWGERQLFGVVDSSTGESALFSYTDPSSATADPALTNLIPKSVSTVYVAFLDSFGPEIAALPTQASETSPTADFRRKIEEVKRLIGTGKIGRARNRFAAIPETWSARNELAELKEALELAISRSDPTATGTPINRQISDTIKDRYGDAWVATKDDEVVQTSSNYSELKRELRKKFADLSGIRIMRVG